MAAGAMAAEAMAVVTALAVAASGSFVVLAVCLAGRVEGEGGEGEAAAAWVEGTACQEGEGASFAAALWGLLGGREVGEAVGVGEGVGGRCVGVAV
jgi:hypothetical protein